MKQAWMIALSVAFVGLLIVAIAWHFWPDTIDPQVATVKQLQRELFQQQASLTDEQRREQFGRLRKEMEQLTDEQRQQMRQEMTAGFRDRMMDEVTRFHELPPEQRTAYLDERIDQMESRRGEGRLGFGPGSGPGGVRQMAAAAKGNGHRSEGSIATSRQGDRPRGPMNLSEEQRQRWRRERLDNSTARQRAEFAAFFEALRARRKERGLPDFGPRRR